ncbi:hypothetical protein [Rossellomorea marisflavi]|uniref:hypothetical protein n=1 Tax=Rossellomorea marisflavi TaxID=189381 RepID=UPI0006500465|nr:hypothetical protein [Rossellomorea marisflavi]KMK95166.1 hypothetical protein VL03_10415 [Rossellomorea marisflavi]
MPELEIKFEKLEEKSRKLIIESKKSVEKKIRKVGVRCIWAIFASFGRISCETAATPLQEEHISSKKKRFLDNNPKNKLNLVTNPPQPGHTTEGRQPGDRI